MSAEIGILRATGYVPVRAKEISKAIEMLADAEDGKVTAFIWIAIGPGFARWHDWTPMTRQDRMNLLGQLEVVRGYLIEAEMRD